MSHSLRLLCVVFMSSFAVLATPAHSSPASSGQAIGFVRIRLSDGLVSAYGGRGTKSVDSGPTTGGIIVFFEGSYPKAMTRDLVVVQATVEAAEGSEFAVANAIVAGADKNTISVTVNAFDSASHAAVDGWVFLTVYQALPPKLPKP